VRSTPFLGICAQISSISKVFLSGHVVLTNGALLDKAGTATIALLAKNARKPIFVLCNTYKFSPKALLDSFCYNETGDPDNVCPDIPGANRLNLMFDVTPCEHLDLIITEHGIVPPTSIHGVIRNTKPRAQ
jgi:translation initiation factor eIF-2B subunit delta